MSSSFQVTRDADKSRERTVLIPNGPTEYVSWVLHLSHGSEARGLFSVRCKRLAQFLQSSHISLHPDLSHKSFAWLYQLGNNQPLNGVSFSDHKMHMANLKPCNHLLFLSGYPSALILAEIGYRYGIDPEFFDRHLSFIGDDSGNCSIHTSHHDLPSTQQVIFQTTVPSIGGIDGDTKYKSTEAKRSASANQMTDYLQNLAMGKQWIPFQSVVRSFEAHDAVRFNLEQAVTILITRNKRLPEKWIVIVWLDAGADLCDSPPGPWLDSSHSPFDTHFQPVKLYEPDTAYLSTYSQEDSIHKAELITAKGLPQSISLLPRAYGQSLDRESMATDPIYALLEVFRFLAHSETQYLDMILSVLEENTAESSTSKTNAHNDVRNILIHTYRALERQQDRIVATSQFLKHRHLLNEFRSHSPLADGSLAIVCRDYDYLVEATKKLMKRCNHELTIIMSELSTEEARRGITQATRSHKFTVLAAIYLPASFACSVFGMNFVIVGNAQTGFKLWAIVCVPIFIVSILFLYWDKNSIARTWQNLGRLFD